MADPARLIPTRLRGYARRTLNRMGVEVSRPAYLNELVARLLAHGIDTVVDIGANEGQYATKLLQARYRDTIISVEPLQAAFASLSARAAGHPNWQVERSAMGAEPGTLHVHVAGNSQSSSVLPMLDLHVQAAPRSRYVGVEDVPASTLDDLFGRRDLDPARCFVKIDVQGYEASVLDGAARVLPLLAMIELELSLAPLYEGQALMPELMQRMADNGLVPWALKPAFADARTGRLLQVDGVFVRLAQ